VELKFNRERKLKAIEKKRREAGKRYGTGGPLYKKLTKQMYKVSGDLDSIETLQKRLVLSSEPTEMKFINSFRCTSEQVNKSQTSFNIGDPNLYGLTEYPCKKVGVAKWLKHTDYVIVVFRLRTNLTGKAVVAYYSTRIADDSKENFPDIRWEPAKSQIVNNNNMFMQQPQQPQQPKQNLFPTVSYKPSLKGPYEGYDDKKGKWKKEPRLIDLQNSIKKLANKLFYDGSYIRVPMPGYLKDKEKDKLFMISDYTVEPFNHKLNDQNKFKLKFDIKIPELGGKYVDYPYKFFIMSQSYRLFALVDIELDGKFVTKQELKKIQEEQKKAAAAKKKMLAKMTPEERERYDRNQRIKGKIGATNKVLTKSCNHHLDAIKSIIGEMAGIEASPTDYERKEMAEKYANSHIKRAHKGRKTRKIKKANMQAPPPYSQYQAPFTPLTFGPQPVGQPQLGQYQPFGQHQPFGQQPNLGSQWQQQWQQHPQPTTVNIRGGTPSIRRYRSSNKRCTRKSRK